MGKGQFIDLKGNAQFSLLPIVEVIQLGKKVGNGEGGKSGSKISFRGSDARPLNLTPPIDVASGEPVATSD